MMKKSYIALLLALPILAGCGSEAIKQFAKQVREFENGTSEQKSTPQPAIYCYNTLGEASCYDKPQPKDSDGSFVGTTVEPVDPKIREHQVQDNIALPPVPVEEVDIRQPDPVLTNPVAAPVQNPDHQDAGKKDPEKPGPVDSVPAVNDSAIKEPIAENPVVENPIVQNEVTAPSPVSQDTPANRPLYDPYLNQMEQKPAEGNTIPPQVQEPIVPPKTKSKKTKKQ